MYPSQTYKSIIMTKEALLIYAFKRMFDSGTFTKRPSVAFWWEMCPYVGFIISDMFLISSVPERSRCLLKAHLWSKSSDDFMEFGVAGRHPVTLSGDQTHASCVAAVCVYCFYKCSACFCLCIGPLVAPPISPSYLLSVFSLFPLPPSPLCPRPPPLPPWCHQPGHQSRLEVDAHVSPPSLLSLSLSLLPLFPDSDVYLHMWETTRKR